MFKELIPRWILLASTIGFADILKGDINLDIKPAVAFIDESIEIQCWFTSRTRGTYPFQVVSPQSRPTYCTYDCAVSENVNCFDVVSESCLCDSIQPSENLCYPNSTKITFTVPNVGLEMDGKWTCYWGSEGSGDDYFKDDFQLAVFVKATDPHIDGNFTVELNSTTKFNCSSLKGNPSPSFYWYLMNNTHEKNVTPDSTPHGDYSILQYTAKIDHNGMDLVCTINQTVEETKRNFSEVLNVTYGAVVDIGPCSNVHVVENNTGMSLECMVAKQGNPPVHMFEWEVKQKHGKLNSRWFNISTVDESDAGSYTCKGNNGVTERQVLDTVTVEIFYHPNNVTIDGKKEVIETDDITLLCWSNGVPNNITYEWITPLGNSNNQTLIIRNATKDHKGQYQCEASNSFQTCDKPYQTGKSSGETYITVFYSPKGAPVIYTNQSVIAVNQIQILYCFIEDLDEQGWPEVEWITWRKSDVSVVNCTSDAYCTNYKFVSHDVNDSGNYTCQAGNTIGGSDISDHFSLTIEAPLTFERFTNSTSSPVYDGAESSEFSLSCMVSASNIKKVVILHNGETMDQTYFTAPNITLYDCAGDCAYGLSSGLKQEVQWLAQEVVLDNCQDLLYYNGAYQCYGEAVTATCLEHFYSERIQVEVFYRPLNQTYNEYQVVEFEQTNISLQCKVCANPEPQYQWYFNDTESDSSIPGAETQNYTVVVADESSFGFYYCEATNEVGKVIVPVELRESGPAESPTNLIVHPNVTSSSLSISWQEGRSGNNPPVEYIIKVGNDHSSNCTADSGFLDHAVVVGTSNGIEGTTLSSVIEGLVPESKYCVRIHGENQRLLGGNKTEDFICMCDQSTASLPHISDFTIEEVASNKMKIRWKYQTQYTDTLYVGLVFLYNELGKDQVRYPANSSVDAALQQVSIPGTFSMSATYEVEVNVFEGNNRDPSPVYIGDTYKPRSGVNIGLTVGLSLLILIIVIGATILLTQRHRLHLDNLFKRQNRDEEVLNSTETFEDIGEENDAFQEMPYAMSDMGQQSAPKWIPLNSNATEGATYAEVDKSKRKKTKLLPGIPVYTEVKKKKKKGAESKLEATPEAGVDYAEVDKKKKKNKKKEAPVPQDVPLGETPYEDVETKRPKPPIAKKPKPTPQPVREVSEDGCVYIKVDFPKYNQQTAGNVIHGKDQMTVYAEIDWTCSPEPIEDQAEPPPYQEEDVMGALPPPRDADV